MPITVDIDGVGTTEIDLPDDAPDDHIQTVVSQIVHSHGAGLKEKSPYVDKPADYEPQTSAGGLAPLGRELDRRDILSRALGNVPEASRNLAQDDPASVELPAPRPTAAPRDPNIGPRFTDNPLFAGRPAGYVPTRPLPNTLDTQALPVGEMLNQKLQEMQNVRQESGLTSPGQELGINAALLPLRIVAGLAGGMTSAKNAALLGAMGPVGGMFGRVTGMTPEMVQQAAAAGFSLDMLKDLVTSGIPAVYKDIKAGDWDHLAKETLPAAIGTGAFAFLSGKHALKGEALPADTHPDLEAARTPPAPPPAPVEVAPPTAPESPLAPEAPPVDARVMPDRRAAERRATAAQELGLPEDHPAVGRVLDAEDLADTHEKTGLINTRAYDKVSQDFTHHVAVDFKGFKDFNDQYGQIEGDKLLRQWGDLVKSAGLGDVVAARGGDEFETGGRTAEEATARKAALEKLAAEAIVEVRRPDGTIDTYRGIPVKSDIGADREALWAGFKSKGRPGGASPWVPEVSGTSAEGVDVHDQTPAAGQAAPEVATPPSSAAGEAGAPANTPVHIGPRAPLPPTAPDRMGTHYGATGFVRTATGKKLPYVWELGDVRDPIASHDSLGNPNPKFSGEGQNRNRGDARYVEQVNQMKGDLHADELAASPKIAEGAPTLRHDSNENIAGHGRQAATAAAYEEGLAGKFKPEIIEEAKKLGLSPEAIADASRPEARPQLRRRLLPGDYNYAELGSDTNVASGVSLGGSEKGKTDSGRMLEPGNHQKALKVLDQYASNEKGDLGAPSSGPFVRAFAAAFIPKNEQGPMFRNDGGVTPEGALRVRGALVGLAYGDDPAVSRLLDGGGDDSAQVKKALMDAAPELARLRIRQAAGEVEPTEVVKPILEATTFLNKIRADGKTLEKVMNPKYGELVSPLDGLSPEARDLVKFFDENKGTGGAKHIQSLIEEIAHAAEAAETVKTEGGLFGAEEMDALKTEPPTVAEIYAEAKGRYETASRDEESPLFRDPNKAVGRGRAQESGGQGLPAAGAEQPGVAPEQPGAEGREGAEPAEPAARGKAGDASGAGASETPDVQEAEPPVKKVDEARSFEQNSTSRQGNTLGTGDFAAAVKEEETGRVPPKPKAAQPKSVFDTEGPGPKSNPLRAARNAGIEIKTLLNPVSRSDAVRVVGESMREATGKAEATAAAVGRKLESAWDDFSKRTKDENVDFLSKFQGGLKQATAALQLHARALKEVLDGRLKAVQDLGIGKLDNFVENYFPQIWKDPKKADLFVRDWMAKRSLEGNKGFLQERIFPTIAEGMAAGLELKHANPVDAVMEYVRTVNQFVATHEVFKENGPEGNRLIRELSVDDDKPAGQGFINDKIGNVWGPRRIPVEEHVDSKLMNDIEAFARDQKIKLTTNTGVGGPIALSLTGKDSIHRKFGSPTGVLIHEIGHVLDDRYGLNKALLNRDAPEIPGELKKLAQLRMEGMDEAGISETDRNYINSPSEKIANFLDAFVNHPDVVRQVAPVALGEFRSFLTKHPELAKLWDLHPTLTRESRMGSVDAGGKVLKGRLIAPQEIADLINETLEPGFSRMGLYQGAMQLNMAYQRIQLLSGFHAGFVALEAPVSAVSLALQKIVNKGTRLEGLADVAKAPFALFSNMKRGSEMKQSVLSGAPNLDAQRAISGGFRFDRDTQFDGKITSAIRRSFKNALNGKEAAGVGDVVRATLGAVSESIPEMVTLAKAGALAKLNDFSLKQLGPEADPREIRHANARNVDTVDDRLGQLNYDNLHWNKKIKDIAQLVTRSVGWNLGFGRAAVGAVTDTATVGGRISRNAEHAGALEKWKSDVAAVEKEHAAKMDEWEKAGSDPAKEPSAPKLPLRPVNLSDPAFTNRMAYALATPAVVAVYGSILQQLLTGKGPQTVRDLFAPRTGGKNNDGSDERVSPPGYAKDVMSYWDQPAQTLAHKASPIVGLMNDVIFRNKDFYGTEIRHPDDNVFQQGKDVLEYLGRAARPFGVQQTEKQKDVPGSKMPGGIGQVGFTSSSAHVTRSDALKKMDDMLRDKAPQGARTKPEFARKSAVDNYTALVRYNNEHGDDAKVKYADVEKNIWKDIDAGLLKSTDLKKILTLSNKSYLQAKFDHLETLGDKLKVYEKYATPAERKELEPDILKAFRSKRAMFGMKDDERERAMDSLQRILASPK